MKKADLKTLSNNTFTTNGTRGITGQQVRNFNSSAIDAMYLNAGSIVVWPGLKANIPTGWHVADGSPVLIDDYQDLYNALGGAASPWGGDGVDHFNLPRIDVFSVPIQSGDDLALGATGGEKNHRLTVNEIPSHSHSMFLKNSGTRFTGGGSASALDEGAGVTGATGGDGYHNNMPPYVGMFYIIKLY